MSNSLWEIPIVLLVSSILIFSMWHFLAQLLS
jgi:hypothetical protein